MKLPAFSCAVAAVLALVGCKALLELDTRKAETVIKEGLVAQTGKSVKSMTCPTSVPLKIGTTFECKGEAASGQALVVSVTVSDDAGTIQWKLTSVDGKPTTSAAPPAAAPKAEPAADPKAEPKDDHDEHK